MKLRVVKIGDRYYPQGRQIGAWKNFSPGFLYQDVSFDSEQEAIEFCQAQSGVVWHN